MSEKDRQIMRTFGKILPLLSEMEKERLLAFGEGMNFKASQQKDDLGPEDSKLPPPPAA